MSSPYFHQSLDGEPRLTLSIEIRLTKQSLVYAVAHALSLENPDSTGIVRQSEMLRLAENFYRDRADSENELFELEDRYLRRAEALVEKFYPEDKHNELREEVG